MSEEKSPEQTPSLRRYSKKEYSVKVVNEADEVIEKKIRLDITSQVRPVGIEPAQLPSQAEVNEALVEQAEKNEFDPLIGAVALQAMRSPTEAEPEGDIELVDAPGVPTLTPREPLTREVAMEKLVEYLGAHLKEGEVVDDEGTKTWLADNLGTLVSSLDGTEEFVAQMKAVAKHPRFYFKKGFSRARTYLRITGDFLNDFPWTYTSDSPSVALADLRKAQAFIGYAITAITGRGSETPELDHFNEDGLVQDARGDVRERSLDSYIKTYRRLVLVLEAVKAKRDEMAKAQVGVTQALKEQIKKDLAQVRKLKEQPAEEESSAGVPVDGYVASTLRAADDAIVAHDEFAAATDAKPE